MKKNKFSHRHIIEQVPPDYYQKGVKNNFLQRKWHSGKLNAVISEIDYYPKKILDIGCASGWFISQIKKKFPKSLCFGIDIYDEAINYGVKRYKNINFKVSDAHKLPFKPETFDLVICTEVLEHVDDPELVIMEIKRILKKNGKAIIELDSGSMLFSIVWYFWRLSRGGVWKHSHLHSFNILKLDSMLKKAGFKIERKQKFNFGMAMIFSVLKNS